MHAHLEDLRAEVRDLAPAQREALLAALASDEKAAELDAVDRALCRFAEKLTHAPARMEQADLQALRSAGLSDAAIHEAIQVVAYFNYINRVADAVHVDLEPGMPAYPESSSNEAAPPA